MSLRFGLLGPVEADWLGRPVALGPPQRRAVLAVLLLARGRAVTVAALRDRIWRTSPPTSAISAIHVHVHHLRAVLGALAQRSQDGLPQLVTHPGHPSDQVSYALRAPLGSVDADRFHLLARRADEAEARGEAKQALVLVNSALALWRGAPLSGLRIPDFCADHVLGLQDLRLDLAKRRATALLAAGATARVTAELRQLCAEYPADEQVVVLLAKSLRKAGTHAGALDLMTREVDRWQREYGIRPRALLRELAANGGNPDGAR
ncbi:BTAD domain-containing putative transcriptional regulator [Streptomyces sp. NPDC020379]|uniref:AfsR/SARP family transcriptional regulator n=1 Tax=Streptomyces sp. NPDC020379 TaxID=3365071 RepID=UPI003793A546